nr:retrotransposon Orf1 [Tanacetum cinerariifolium]
MTNKIDIVLKAITDRITRALPKEPQCSTRIHRSINAITICPKQPKKFRNDKSDKEEEEKVNPKNINTTPPSPLDPSISFITEKLHKLNSFLESSGLVPISLDTKFVCTKKDDGNVMLIEIIKNYDDSHEELFEVEDISLFIDPRLSQVVLGKPFIEISNMTRDLLLGVVKFTGRINEIAYKISHRIEQYNSLPDLEKEHTKSVYLRNEEDKRRGVECAMKKKLGFYKECLELGPEYLTGVVDKEGVT